MCTMGVSNKLWNALVHILQRDLENVYPTNVTFL